MVSARSDFLRKCTLSFTAVGRGGYDVPMSDALQIHSITGVDVELRIAGPGGRSFAFVVDWHIRLLLALAWYVLGALLLIGTLSAEAVPDAGSGFVYIVVLPATALFFLYHPVVELVMQGRTPGKRMAGIRIVNQAGEVPGPGAILIRNVLRLVDSLPGVYAIGLAATVLTDQSVRIGDMAAGTLLVYEDDSTEDIGNLVKPSVATVGLENLALVNDVIDRWEDLEADVRCSLGQRLLTRLGHEPPAVEADVLSALMRVQQQGRD